MKLFARLEVVGRDGEVLAVRNEPVRPVRGGFARELDDAWAVDLDPREIDSVRCVFLGVSIELPIPRPPDGETYDRTVVALGPMLLTIRAADWQG